MTQQPAATGGLFGSATTTTQPSGGGLFGNTQSMTTNTGGVFFGSGTTTGQSMSGGGLLGGSQAKPAVEACLRGRRPRRILTTCAGVASNSNPIHLGVPLMPIRCRAVKILGISTFRSGQQPQQQQLTAGSLLLSRSTGRSGQQGQDSNRINLRMLILLLG